METTLKENVNACVRVETERQFKKLLSLYPVDRKYSEKPFLLDWDHASGYRTRIIRDGIHVSGRGDADGSVQLWKHLLIVKGIFQIMEGNKSLMNALKTIPEAANMLALIKNSDCLMSFSAEQHGKYTYARKKDDSHNEKRRVITTFQRIMRTLGSDEPDHILSGVAAKLYPMLWGDTVREISGPDISNFYYDNRSILTSCMTDKEDTEMYSINPSVCRLAVIRKLDKEGTVIGGARCMLFVSSNGKTYHSRIYYSHPEYQSAMKEYLESKGYLDGYKEGHSGYVTMKIPDSGFVPYMDIFRYTDDVPLAGCECSFSSNGRYVAECTDGTVDGIETCDRCGCPTDDLVYVNGYGDVCISCADEISFTCERCGDRFHNDSLHEVMYNGEMSRVCDRCAARIISPSQAQQTTATYAKPYDAVVEF